MNTITEGLTDILNAALDSLNSATLQQITQAPPGGCPVLDLALGPLELNLLGLVVELDDCANGPVTVTITAVPGEGNLLGNLLCGLLGLLDPGITLEDILQAVLQAILNALQGL